MKIKTLPFCFGMAAALFAGACAGFVAPRLRYRDGVYGGRGEGYWGPIEVSLRIEDGGIAEIIMVSHKEDPLVGGAALEELIEAALAANSPGVDAVSGATGSSGGFLAAMEEALSRAAAPGTTPEAPL